MIVIDRLVVGGLRFVLDKVARAVDEELSSPERLKEELLAAQLQHELGEIDDEELAAIEDDILARLRELREAEEGAGAPISFGTERSGDVEISFGGD